MPVIASSHLDDDAFLAAFERCTLPLSCFRHGDHLRLAWIYLHRMSFDAALDAVCVGIRRFAAHHGVSHIFHATVTEGWVRLVATHSERSFAEFVEGNASRLNGELLHHFWSPHLLASAEARTGWVVPDRRALPLRF